MGGQQAKGQKDPAEPLGFLNKLHIIQYFFFSEMKQYMILAIKLGTWKFRHGLIFKNKTIYYMCL